MIQTIKNRKRGSNLPISIGSVLKIVLAVAGFTLWGWSFVAVVAGAWVFFRILKGLLSLLLYLLIIAVIVTLLVVIIF